jgi:hypothetical protein
MTVYMWLLSSLTPSIASTVDGIERVKDVWEKLTRTYDGVGNNLRVFQIEREIEAADCLTKGLNSLNLARGCDKMGLVSFAHLEGEC